MKSAPLTAFPEVHPMPGIKLGSTLVIPLLLSALLTLLANPIVNFLHRFKVPRVIGIISTLIALSLDAFAPPTPL